MRRADKAPVCYVNYGQPLPTKRCFGITSVQVACYFKVFDHDKLSTRMVVSIFLSLLTSAPAAACPTTAKVAQIGRLTFARTHSLLHIRIRLHFCGEFSDIFYSLSKRWLDLTYDQSYVGLSKLFSCKYLTQHLFALTMLFTHILTPFRFWNASAAGLDRVAYA